MSPRVFDAIIAGGGFSGLVAAASLAAAGLEVLVIEPRFGGTDRTLRGELLHPFAVRALRELGLEIPLRVADAVPIVGFVVRDSESTSTVLLPYSDEQGLALEHSHILRALERGLEARPRITLVAGRVVELLRERDAIVGVRCSNGSTFATSLVVAADGRHSKTRRQLGLDATTTLVSHMLATTIDARALDVPEHGHVFVGGPGPVLAYPLGDGLARVNVDVPLGAPHGRAALLAYLETHYAEHVPRPLFDVILAGFSSQPLLGAANHAMVTDACAVPGAVLLGDSGGCSHPLAATGMTCALNDATTLAEAVRVYGTGEKGLTAYQKARYDFVRPREAFAKALYEVLLGADAETKTLRQGVFRYWEDPRARRASMDILAAEESSTRAFVLELARVLGSTAAAALSRGRRDSWDAVLVGSAATFISIGTVAIRERFARRAAPRVRHARPYAKTHDSHSGMASHEGSLRRRGH